MATITRPQATKPMIITKAAAQRILRLDGLDVTRIISLQIHNAAQTTIRISYRIRHVGICSTLVSRDRFVDDFIRIRKEAGSLLAKQPDKLIQVSQNVYSCWGSAGDHYTIVLSSDGIFCDCQDFCNQMEVHGKGCCKHGYAVLMRGGYGSLQAYLDDTQSSCDTKLITCA